VKFTEKGLTEPILFKSRTAEFREGARKQGIKIIAEYATLGRYARAAHRLSALLIDSTEIGEIQLTPA